MSETQAPDRPQPRRRSRRERGQAIVEFALVSTCFFLLAFGIIDTARLLQSWVTVQHASREAARYAITGQIKCTGITSDRPACIVKTAKAATAGLYHGGATGTGVTVSCKYWKYPSYADPAITDGSCDSTDVGSQCDAIEVDVHYTHHFVVPFINLFAPSGIPLTGSQRMVNEPFGPCG